MGISGHRFIVLPWFVAGAVAIMLAACAGGEQVGNPTRTPVPTWTATLPAGLVVDTPTQQPQAETATAQPADSPTATTTGEPAVANPAETPTAQVVVSETVTPEPIPTTTFAFDLETAEKFPTDSLAPNMVRVYLYVYDAKQLGLAGYRMRVNHDGNELEVDALSEGGLPTTTQTTPGPYTRFTNMNAVFVESQSGRWEVQLIDPNGAPVGPSTVFDLTADESTRELYVRYRLK